MVGWLAGAGKKWEAELRTSTRGGGVMKKGATRVWRGSSTVDGWWRIKSMGR